MEALMMTLSSGVVSGVRPYLMLFVLGAFGRFLGIEQIPAVMQRTDVLVITAVLLLVDFAADKIQVLDSVWDAIHTVVRPVAGGAIGYLLGGETDTTYAIVLGIVGLLSATSVHAAKATTRVAVNASPEPASNVMVSVAEDIVAVVLSLLVVVVPIVAGIAALFLLIAAVILTVMLWRFIRRIRRRPALDNPPRTYH